MMHKVILHLLSNVGDYQEAAGRAQEVNNQANSALRQQNVGTSSISNSEVEHR